MAQARDHRVVILGAGFAGLNAAMELARLWGRERAGRILLVDRVNAHLFTPILYHVATGLVEPGHIAYPVRVVAHRYGFDFHESVVRGVDLERRQVATDDGPLPYERLVLALGGATNFFGLEEVRRSSLTLKTLGDAIRIRNQLVEAFERAAVEPDARQRRKWLTFVVVGGGATGVELMGSMATLIREAMLATYTSVRPREVRLVLVEALPRLLGGLDPRVGQMAARRLQERGVELRLGTMVTRVTEDGTTTKTGEFLPAATVIWAAGVRASPLADQLPLERGKGGRIVVDACLEVPGWPGVHALGDVACFTDPSTGRPLPPNAAVAVRQGSHLARNLAAVLEGSRPRPFRYQALGELISLGRNVAVAEIKGLRFDGLPAWLVWRSFYLSHLMGFKNQLGVLLDWSYAYFRRRDIARLDMASEWATEAEMLGLPAREAARRRAAS
ncbi:MAG: NAD(P)/FAD-dependent oxidoreductase [Chloroflexi bacterium]|nr:NAD(P)/FAD-dependent oxidoreductase [Chloroflexota bacterium]